AFSVNRIFQSFYGYGDELIEVYDKASDLIVYDIEKNEITTCPQISTKDNETYPNWSPDGKFLYYCRAPQWTSNIPVDSFRYSLMRIAFDEKARSWGTPETILDAEKIQKSVTFPRVSPDGKYILLCLSNHGVFSIFFPSSDLYLYSIATGELKKLPVNSNDVDSYHSWSSNGRWVVFSSKRMNKIHTRPFFFHIDENGTTSKPFVLPAEDPHFYETFLRNYNIPEFIKRPININTLNLIQVAHKKGENVTFDKNVNIDALSGATRIRK
ncbi:MAG: TolB family protein, partial [Bacteroidales bacterium]